MKKLTYVLFALAALLMLAAPAFAAGSDSPGYDIMELDGAPAAVSTAPDGGAQSTPTPVVDVPVDESTYREETPAGYQPAQRLSGRGKIAGILQYWEENGYPADVSYAFEAGGEMMEDGTVYAYWEIGLVDADEARKEEILDLVSPACLVEFKNCLFTHAQKKAAYDAITELAVDDPNILGVIFVRNDDTVWVAVPEERAKEYAEYLIRDLELGAVVSVTDEHSIATLFDGGMEIGVATPGMGMDAAAPGGTTGSVMTGSGLVPASPAVSRPSPMFQVCMALAVVAVCALTVLALRRWFVPAAVSENGEIRTPSAPLTRAQAEQAVRDGVEAPPAALFRAIVERGQGEPKE